MNGPLHYRRAKPGVGGTPGRQINPRIAVTLAADDMAAVARIAAEIGCPTAAVVRQFVRAAVAQMGGK
jgi:hypothetical protein